MSDCQGPLVSLHSLPTSPLLSDPGEWGPIPSGTGSGPICPPRPPRGMETEKFDPVSESRGSLQGLEGPGTLPPPTLLDPPRRTPESYLRPLSYLLRPKVDTSAVHTDPLPREESATTRSPPSRTPTRSPSSRHWRFPGRPLSPRHRLPTYLSWGHPESLSPDPHLTPRDPKRGVVASVPESTLGQDPRSRRVKGTGGL